MDILKGNRWHEERRRFQCKASGGLNFNMEKHEQLWVYQVVYTHTHHCMYVYIYKICRYICMYYIRTCKRMYIVRVILIVLQSCARKTTIGY